MRELSVTEQRYQAVLAVISDGETVSSVAARFGVHRKTVHGWLARHGADGPETHLATSWRVLGCRAPDPQPRRHDRCAEYLRSRPAQDPGIDAGGRAVTVRPPPGPPGRLDRLGARRCSTGWPPRRAPGRCPASTRWRGRAPGVCRPWCTQPRPEQAGRSRVASEHLRRQQATAVRAAGGHVADPDERGSGSAAFARDPALFSADWFHPSCAGYAV